MTEAVDRDHASAGAAQAPLAVARLPRGAAQFVMKITKHCNLRCAYCYEYAELANKRRMSLDVLRRIFINIARDATASGFEAVSFIWHGGEPFMVPLDYYESIGALQQDVFGADMDVGNVVQTNLTILTEKHLQLLEEKRFFAGVGVSFDVHGDQRVDTQGRLRTRSVIDNLQRLADRQIPFGGIAVLARNAAYVSEIFRFYDQLGAPFRFLPFYMNSFEAQISEHAISYRELVSALKLVFDEWIVSERATFVDPIDEYMDFAVAHLAGRRGAVYRKERDESVFVVDVDGGVWGKGEPYEKQYKYGDLSRESFAATLNSQARRFALEETEARLERHCGNCPYFGACPGHFVGDASPQQKALLEASGCPVREVLDHVVQTLERSGTGAAIAPQAARNEEPAPALGA